MAVTAGLPDVRRLAFRVVLGQAAVTVAAAGVSWLSGGSQAALSALLGGGISTAGSLAMALIGFRNLPGASGLQMLASLLIGETAKLGVVIVLFALALTLIRISGAAMLVTYAATFLVYWIVLASWLPVFTRGRREARRAA